MTVHSSTISGHTAMPFSGTLRCGYMRPIHHHCKDSSCPLNLSLVMVLAEGLGPAIDSCHRLWDTRDQQIIVQRFKVLADTFQVNNEGLERGLLKDDPESWTRLRSMVEEQQTPILHLSNIGALISQAGSPGHIWVPQSQPLQLPKNPRIGRSSFEDASWLDGDLEPPDVLLDLDDEVDDGEPSEGL